MAEQLNCMKQEKQLKQKTKKKVYRIVINKPRDNKEGSLLPENKLLLVIRNGGEDDMCPTSRELLHSLRLWKLYTGVFVKADETTMAVLQKLEPFVTYGYPPLKTLKELIYYSTALELDNQITELNDNNAVKQAFGQYNINCFQDIVNEIANVGSHFGDVSKALRPFTLHKRKKASCHNDEHVAQIISEEVPQQQLVYIDEEKQLEQMIQQKRFRVRINKPSDKEGPLLPEAKPIFIIRSGGEDDMCPTSRELLHSLRLWKLHTGVFVKADESIMVILQKLEPFITYGYPPFKTVKGLIYRSGAIELDKEIIKLKDNNVVEQAFGQYNIICIEDIINEIANVGSHFGDVSKALRPFTLHKRKKAPQRKRHNDEQVPQIMGEEVPQQQLIYMDEEKQLLRMIQKKRFRVRINKPSDKEGPLLPEAKPIFIIRSGGEDDMCPTSRELLHSLRLWKVHTGVFVKADESIMVFLRKSEPFITYGYPPFKTVKGLIYRSGAIELDKQITKLKDNNVVEQAFGQYNIICIEDIINEIANVGPHFEDVSKALCPFTLHKQKKALQGKKKRHNDGGHAGNREDHVNELICKFKNSSIS